MCYLAPLYRMLSLCLLLGCVLSEATGQGFYLVDRDGNPTNNGLLIADRIGSHKVGAVCDDEFNNISAAVICHEMGYNSSTSFASGTQYDWAIKNDYVIVLDDIMCVDPDDRFISCSYVLDDDCDNFAEQIFLECSCSENNYIRREYKGCAPCPEGSVLSTWDKMACMCGPGNAWNKEECKECPANTYKTEAGISTCSPCPEHSASGPGSHTCSCAAGYYWSNAACFKCPVGSVSTRGSRECHRCSSGSSPLRGNTACSCPGGLHWNTTHCVTCPANHYSTENSTSCSPCPQDTVSEPGSAHCYHCPWGHVWQDYACLPCSHALYEGCPTCPAGYSIRGNMCIEDKTPMEQKAAPNNWGTIVLAVLLVVLLLSTILLAIRLLRMRRRAPPKSAAPLVPYHMVRESSTMYNSSEEPEYVRPDENVIYAEPNAYVDTEIDAGTADPQYVESDRYEVTEYVQADSVPAYSAFCGAERQDDGFTENIYDNI